MKKEFRLSDKLRKEIMASMTIALIMAILCFTGGIFSLYGKLDRIIGLSFILLSVLFSLWAWLNIATVKVVRLVLTPEQLEFYSPGLVLWTSWDNIARIGRISIRGKPAKYDSLVLRVSANQRTTWWFKLLRKDPEHEIPLSMFSNWRTTELGQEIKKYAPRLFLEGSPNK